MWLYRYVLRKNLASFFHPNLIHVFPYLDFTEDEYKRQIESKQNRKGGAESEQ